MSPTGGLLDVVELVFGVGIRHQERRELQFEPLPTQMRLSRTTHRPGWIVLRIIRFYARRIIELCPRRFVCVTAVRRRGNVWTASAC
jgi:hypothetical protein